MYDVVLFIHSILRWLVVGTALFALGSAIHGLASRRDFGKGDSLAGLLFVIAIDLQLLIGVLLYTALSSITQAAMANMGEAMKVREWRFWAVEHAFAMLAAVALVHVGRVKVRRATSAAQKHRRALAWFGAAVVAILVGIPWPFLSYGRPLFHLP